MHSIKTKISVFTIGAIVITMIIAAVFGVLAIRNISQSSSEKMLQLLCEAGQKNLDASLISVEKDIESLSAYIEADLDGLDDQKLQAHLDRINSFFKKVLNKTNGVMTYYYRIDPSVSKNVKGFWFVNTGEDFQEHEVTDITMYDTEDTSQLVWFTVPKATGKPVWLPPYITDNLNAKVISYNTPVYLDGQFVGVIGIELDYSFMAEMVNNIKLYENGYAFVNDEDGNLVYHPRMDVTTMETLPEVPDGMLNRDGIIHYTYEGVEKIAVSLPLTNGDLINVSVPVSEVTADMLKWIKLIIIVFSVLLALFILFILRFTGRITRPLRELTVAAKQIDEGKYDHTLEYDRDDEIGKLTRTFSSVSAHLKQYIADLNEITKQLTQQKESMSALLDNMPAMSFSKDAETGAYLACNQAFADYARLNSPEDVTGLNDRQIFDPVTAEHFIEMDRKTLAADEPLVYFEDVLDANGSSRQLQTTKLKFYDANGRLCILGVCTDVTDIRAKDQADRMITAMAADYRCVYYINLDENDGVCYRNDPGDPSLTPAGVHFPYMERIKWYAENYVTEIYREGFLEFVDPDNIRERLSTQPIIAYRYLAKKGKHEYYEMIRVAGVRRAEERDDHMVHAIGLGLTEIDAEMRETMSKNEALAEALGLAEEASKAKTAFLSNMSHEIRTPMNAIIGLDTLALNDKTISDETRNYLEKIGSSARHLLQLINDILDMSRIESGHMVLKKEEFSFSAMLEQINTMVLSQCEQKGLYYEYRMLSPVDDAYIGDDMKLKEVLINILSNAVKFTNAPGTITLTVEKTAEFEERSTLRFRVKDTGIGMSRDYIPRLFEPFSQEAGSAKNKYGSTGLGMAITKSMVEMMNGTISVESVKGVGTEFTVVVTLKKVLKKEMGQPGIGQTELGQSEEKKQAELAGRRVLVAEDIEMNAEILMDLLEMEAVESDHAENGRIAVEMFTNSAPGTYAAILMDIRMPVMDGLEAAKAIRALDRTDAKKIPIIALTANAFDEDVQRSLQAGMNAHLSKPVEPEHLYQTLGELIYEAET